MHASFSFKPEAVVVLEAGDKAEILGALAGLFASAWQLDANLVLEHIEERERLGSTGFGRGVAIPHARIPGITRPIAALIKLKRQVAFDAADGLPVDLVIGLLSPENSGASHLHALAAISRLVRDERIREALTETSDAEVIFGLITNATDRDAA